MATLNLNPFKQRPATAPPVLSLHRTALRENLSAIAEARTRLESILAKDRQAQSDIAQAESVAREVDGLQEQIDRATADANYNGDPAPDLTVQRKALAHAQETHKHLAERARAATHVRQRYASDMDPLHGAIRELRQHTSKLLFDCLREDCLPSLAEEYLQKEREFKDIFQRVFAAASAVDSIAMSQAFGQFVASQRLYDLSIPRPDHEAFWPEQLLPEQAQAARRQFASGIADEAKQLLDSLLNAED